MTPQEWLEQLADDHLRTWQLPLCQFPAGCTMYQATVDDDWDSVVYEAMFNGEMHRTIRLVSKKQRRQYKKFRRRLNRWGITWQ